MRARWEKEDTGRGAWQVVVTEIPWLVQKSRLVEKIAELINEQASCRSSAMCAMNSAEDIRLVIEPRTRARSMPS